MYKKGSPQATTSFVNVSIGPEAVFANRYSSFKTFINESRNYVLIDIENVDHIT